MTCCPLGPGDGMRMGSGWELAGQGPKASWMHGRRTMMVPRFFLLVIMTSCTPFRYSGRGRERELILLAAVSWTEARK